MSKFKNKVVWITGASSGIGEALAMNLAGHGARLILSSRRESVLKQVKINCQLSDQDCLVLPLDLEKYQEMAPIVAKAIAHFGRVDVLINNGGISQRSMILDTDMQVYRRIMDIDYLGTVGLTKALLPFLIQQQSGHVAVITSLMGKFSAPRRSGYCGAKHALHGFFDALRLEHEDDNIKVTLICPGYVHTDISKNALTAKGDKQNTMDKETEQGLSPQACAKAIITAIDQEKQEIYVGGKETMGVYLKRWFPKLLHRVVKKNTKQ